MELYQQLEPLQIPGFYFICTVVHAHLPTPTRTPIRTNTPARTLAQHRCKEGWMDSRQPVSLARIPILIPATGANLPVISNVIDHHLFHPMQGLASLHVTIDKYMYIIVIYIYMYTHKAFCMYLQIIYSYIRLYAIHVDLWCLCTHACTFDI